MVWVEYTTCGGGLQPRFAGTGVYTRSRHFGPIYVVFTEANVLLEFYGCIGKRIAHLLWVGGILSRWAIVYNDLRKQRGEGRNSETWRELFPAPRLNKVPGWCALRSAWRQPVDIVRWVWYTRAGAFVICARLDGVISFRIAVINTFNWTQEGRGYITALSVAFPPIRPTGLAL